MMVDDDGCDDKWHDDDGACDDDWDDDCCDDNWDDDAAVDDEGGDEQTEQQHLDLCVCATAEEINFACWKALILKSFVMDLDPGQHLWASGDAVGLAIM